VRMILIIFAICFIVFSIVQCMSEESCPPYVWSGWSTCTKNCEGGRRFRTANYAFLCSTDDICKQQPNEYEDCNTQPCNDTAKIEEGIHLTCYHNIVMSPLSTRPTHQPIESSNITRRGRRTLWPLAR